MAKRMWRAKMNCQMPWHDFIKNETIELDDNDVTQRVKDLFECLTPEEVKAEESAKKDDPEVKVMVSRLKAAKIPMRRGITASEVRVLFNKFLVEGTTAEQIASCMK